MVDSAAKLRIRVIGPLKILKPSGEDCTPRGRKACALIAMLALSPENKRSRVWVQDRLWGSRGREQGAASLRQSLAEIRKALGDERACLLADNYILSLDPNLFETDIDREALLGREQDSELLEGLDIAEEGFEDWLRGQGQSIGERDATTTNG